METTVIVEAGVVYDDAGHHVELGTSTSNGEIAFTDLACIYNDHDYCIKTIKNDDIQAFASEYAMESDLKRLLETVPKEMR